MTQTCSTCGRSWDGRATFCGVCGALLDTPLPSQAGRRDGDRSGGPWWQRPAVVGGVTAAVVLAAVAAVPTLSIERSAPVPGAIGVPEADDLQAAPRDTQGQAQQPRRPPEVDCSRGDDDLACVAWSRGLAPPPSEQEGGSWVLTVGELLLVPAAGHVEAADARTGTRLWRVPLPASNAHPVGVGEDALAIEAGGAITVIDLDDGRARWEVVPGPRVAGDVVSDTMVLTGTDRGAGTPGLAGRTAADGEVRWVWSSPWQNMYVQQLPDDRVLVTPGDGEGLALLEASTGRELARSDVQAGWILDVLSSVAVTVTPREVDAPPGLNPAGDPGATLTGIDLADGSVRWQQDVRASRVAFGTAEGLVLAPSTNRVTALDADTGEIAWEARTDSTEAVAHHGRLTVFAPFTTKSTAPVVVTLDQRERVVRARDPATGDIAWEHEVFSIPQHAIVSDDGVLVFTNGGFTLLAADTGRQRAHIRAPNASMVGVDPYVLFHFPSGYVTRLDLPEAPR